MTVVVLQADATSRIAQPASPSADINWLAVTRGIRSGSGQNFDVYYECYFNFVFREIRMLAATDEATSLDLLQDVMFKIVRSVKPIASKPQLDSWTRTVIRSVVYDWLRRRKKQTQLSSEQLTARTCDDPATGLEMGARMHWIEEQLKQVEPELRSMISLRYRLGWSLSQIAERFGLKTGAVDGRIRRAVEQLKRKAELEYHD